MTYLEFRQKLAALRFAQSSARAVVQAELDARIAVQEAELAAQLRVQKAERDALLTEYNSQDREAQRAEREAQREATRIDRDAQRDAQRAERKLTTKGLNILNTVLLPTRAVYDYPVPFAMRNAWEPRAAFEKACELSGGAFILQGMMVFAVK